LRDLYAATASSFYAELVRIAGGTIIGTPTPNGFRRLGKEDLLAADPDVRKYLSEAEIAENFDLGYHLKEVDTIFARVFGAT